MLFAYGLPLRGDCEGSLTRRKPIRTEDRRYHATCGHRPSCSRFALSVNPPEETAGNERSVFVGVGERGVALGNGTH